jgi:hypothetical protein
MAHDNEQDAAWASTKRRADMAVDDWQRECTDGRVTSHTDMMVRQFAYHAFSHLPQPYRLFTPPAAAPKVASDAVRQEAVCSVCKGRTFAAIDVRQFNGTYAPGPERRCINCKTTFTHQAFEELLSPPASDAAKDAEIAALKERVAELEGALNDVLNPLGYLKRQAEAEGNQLGGMAYAIANDPGTFRAIARAALNPEASHE